MNTSQVADRLMQRVDELAARVVARVWEGLPGYDSDHMRRSEFEHYVTPALLAVLTAMRDGRRAADERLAEIGRRRALQGVPVDAVVQSWRIAERLTVDEFLAFSGELAPQELREGTARISAIIDQLVRASIEAYRRTQDEVTVRYERVATDLIARLATSAQVDTEEIAYQARLVEADPHLPYQAVALGLASPLTAHGMRPVQRRVLAELATHVRERILVSGWKQHVMLVVPCAERASDLVAPLQRAVQDPHLKEAAVVGVGGLAEQLAEARSSCRQAEEALEVGLRLGHMRRVLAFADVLPEVLLLHNKNLSSLLVRSRLGIFQNKPHFLETLRAYLSCGLSVRATARALVVHPNTVVYRLQRISKLTERDLNDVVALLDVLLALRALEVVSNEDLRWELPGQGQAQT